MYRLLAHYTTGIWILLSSLTGLSWWLATQGTDKASSFDVRVASSIILLVAFFKVRLIGLHFMELRYAPLALRLLFEVWVFVVCSTLLYIYWH